ncbi:methionine--tRNA ligase [Rickettsiales bacterium (ex Bugula neritina AB1)]|nr:methionine--tRNA ligase [Rickettsiales bacterium (ex Bugula neritina AB1)]
MKYFTTPIFYVNSFPHIGTAHNMCLTDFLFKAFNYFGDQKSYLLTGTDEHGQKIYNSAKKNNIQVIDFVDKNVILFKDLANILNIKYNRFIRTTDEDHKYNVLKVWNLLLEKNFLYKDIYKGWYSERDECYFQEKEIYTKDNKKYSISTNAPLEFIEEECYFFKLSFFKEKLLNFYKEHPKFVIPNNLVNELIQFTNNIKDLCVSRKIDWGIDIPGENSKIYVWLDALFNYITAIGGVENYNKNLWNNVVHVIGKDIIIFHGVYWPALLMALDIEPPKNLLVHGWWLIDENKISKSLGNMITPKDILWDNSDYMRYYFCREGLIGRDSNFSMDKFVNIINNEVMDKFCNLFYRVFSILKKNFPQQNILIHKNLQAQKDISDLKDILYDNLKNFYVHKFIEKIVEFVDRINRLIEKEKIWENFNDHLQMYLINVIIEIIDIYEIIIPNLVGEIKNMYKLNDNILIIGVLKPFFKKITVQK